MFVVSFLSSLPIRKGTGAAGPAAGPAGPAAAGATSTCDQTPADCGVYYAGPAAVKAIRSFNAVEFGDLMKLVSCALVSRTYRMCDDFIKVVSCVTRVLCG